MSGFQVPNLAYLRNIPVIGGRLYEALHGAQKAINAMAIQGNLNPSGQIEAPPAIQGVSATGGNGVLHVSIQHTSADVQRGVAYYVEHADNPSFINPQVRNIGDSRSFSEFVGSQARYVRAYAAYPGSPAGPSLYHGGQATPQAVDAGGAIGPAPYLPSQGSGTGAPGQGGVGPGPVPIRTAVSGFDWKLQRPIASEGVSTAQSPGSQNGIGSVDQSGGTPGGGVATAESNIAACEYLASVAGTGNAITGVTTVPYSSLANGFLIRYVPIHDNSAATTIAVNGIAAKAITKNGTSALVGGELVTGKCYLLMFDGTRFQIVGVIAPISSTVLGSDSHGVPNAASLSNASIWIGSLGNLPVEEAISGDAALAANGALTLATVNADVGTFGDGSNVSQVTLDAKGRVIAAVNVPITASGTSGFTGSATVRNAAGTGTSTFVFADGLCTGYTP